MRIVVLAMTMVVAAAPAADLSLAAFLTRVQQACARNDRQGLASLVEYPLTVFASGWNIPVKDRATFLQSYDAFFTEDVRDAIAAASTQQQIGAGAAFLAFGKVLRIRPVDGGFRIVAIVMPPPGQKLRAARSGTTRVSFPAHYDVTQYAGSLAVGEREWYVVRAKRNELLEVRLDGFAGRAAVARVLDASSGAPLDARAREGSRAWIGRVPVDGDYRIEVVRTIHKGDPVLIYRLTVRLR
jgi:hypothetical protein